MTVQHLIEYNTSPPTKHDLQAMFDAIETEDEAQFLAASEVGVLEAVLPEWSRMKGACNTQHRNHDFTLDVHTAKVVVKTRKSSYFTVLSPHWKRLVTLAALLHDIAKDAGPAEARQTISPDALHPLKGAAVARRLLPVWGFSAIDTFCVAALIRYHQLFGHLIIRHNKLGHPPTYETLLQHAHLFPDEQFLEALLPLTEGDIRAVKANDSIFNAEVERKLYDYSQGVRQCIQAIRDKSCFKPLPICVDDATQMAFCYGQLATNVLYNYGGRCECGLENVDTDLCFPFTPLQTADTAINAYALLAFVQPTSNAQGAWFVRNPFPA